MNHITSVFKALSDKNRLRVISALMKHDELCACQITELIQVTAATVSRHLSQLISSQLVDSRKEGRWVYYRLCRERKEFEYLFNWIETQLIDNNDASVDAKQLITIIAYDQEDLCRKQRGEKCCPKR